MDINKLIARVKAILLTPKTEWPVIAGEPATVADIYKSYVVVLAAIPAVFSFLQMSVIGTNLWLTGPMRMGIGIGLSSAIVTYVLTLVTIYVMALIIDALAPTFSAQKDRVQALKTVAYAYTASWIAGIGYILPGLGFLLTIVGGIYSIYLLYLGLPHTMKCPQEKAAGYTAVSIIIAIILSILVGAVVGGMFGMGAYMRSASTFHTSDDVDVDKDSPLGKVEQWSKNVESAGKQLEAAQKSGDQHAQSDAMKKMMGAALGSGDVEALPPDRLKPFLPETLAGMSRSNFSVARNNAMGIQLTEAKATYSDDAGRSVDLEITDTGTAQGLLALAGWSGMEGESETDHGYEKTYRKDGRLVHEQWDKGDSRGEYAVVIGERFTVKVEGKADSMNELKSALDSLDLSSLEALKGEGIARN
jgi:hypothetical protein